MHQRRGSTGLAVAWPAHSLVTAANVPLSFLLQPAAVEAVVVHAACSMQHAACMHGISAQHALPTTTACTALADPSTPPQPCILPSRIILDLQGPVPMPVTTHLASTRTPPTASDCLPSSHPSILPLSPRRCHALPAPTAAATVALRMKAISCALCRCRISTHSSLSAHLLARFSASSPTQLRLVCLLPDLPICSRAVPSLPRPRPPR